MSSSRTSNANGEVSLIAAGPGDPGLLTVCASGLLAAADVIITDPECEELARSNARPGAEVIVAAGADGQVADHWERVRLVIDPAQAGRRVARLMAGDPVLDGSLALEAEALAKAGLTYDIAPGVSTVTGTAAYAGFALTGGRARELRVVEADDPEVDWPALADPHATVVVINGAERAPEIARTLMGAGRDPGTPVAITGNCTTVDQRSLISTLGQLAEALKHSPVTSAHAVLVIGEVVAQCAEMSWFESKPLFGWRVLVPRTKEQAGMLSEQLRHYGAVPVEVPTISVEPPRTPAQMERAVHGLVSGRYQWVAFTSANAVRAVKERFDQYGLDSRAFAGLKVAAVGEQTAAVLASFGISADLVPSGEQSTAGLLEVWPDFDSDLDPINRVFLPRADIATETLAAGLAELGWEVDDVTAYRTVRAAPPAAEIREAIKGGGFDAVLFTSSSTVRNLVGIAGKPHASTVVACIGPQTVRTAEENGLRVDVMAETPSVAALASALAAHGEALRRHALEQGETAWRPARRRTTNRRKAT